ncbi:MAG: DsbC family protein [Burkholderiales bacterium]|nr:DsbC family protein [Burkholderiales bacterium]
MLIRSFAAAIALLSPLLFSPLAYADEAALKKAVEAKFPQAKVESVTKSPYPGLYEVVIEGQLVYADEGFNYLFDGSIIETKNLANLTEQRKQKLSAVKFDALPLDLAIKNVRGNGKRKLAVFSDPDCPYCKKIEKDLAKLKDVTIYTFLYPIESLHPNADEKAAAIWCSADRVKAWDDLMLRGIAPAADKACKTPLAEIAQFGQKLKINGTPTLIFADGQRIPGAIPGEQIEKLLEAAHAAK